MRQTRNFECEGDGCEVLIVGVGVKHPRLLGWIETHDQDGRHAFHAADCVLKYYVRHPAEDDDPEEIEEDDAEPPE